MAKKTFALDVANFEIVAEDYSNDQLAVVEVYVCHDGNNRHNVPISREALVAAKDTLKNKFLVAGYDGVDFEGHEPDEMIVGFFPESSKMRFELRGERTYLVAQAIMSKVYAKWAYDIFADKGNHRDVSMEITVLRGEVDEFDNLLTIDEFVFNGVTILGVDHIPACEGSGASIIKFDCENALKVYNEHRDETTMVKFSGKEETGTMDETKEVVEEVEVNVEAETKEDETKETETTETQEESSKEDDKTMYSEDDKEEKKDFESEDDKSDEEKDDDESKEDVEKDVEECVNNEADEESDSEEVDECVNAESDESLPTENYETEDEPEDEEEDEGESEEDYESVKAERDSLLEKCEALESKVAKYEAKEKSVQVESIISGVIDLFSAEEIAELREEAEKFSLEELGAFDNEVKARAFDRVKKDSKSEKKNFTKVAINEVLDKPISKYTW